jgi:26S proteasome regulatory subunit N5
MLEADGDTEGAAEMLQQIQVETVGSMELTEKTEFLLEQVRLCLARKDYVRAEIIANKVNLKTLDLEANQDQKIKHYTLQVELHSHRDAYLTICKAYQHIVNTPKVHEDNAKWPELLKAAALFAILTPYDSEASDQLLRIKAMKHITDLPDEKKLLEQFTMDEIIYWPLSVEGSVRESTVFRDAEKGAKRWNDLHKRVVQHNLRVVGTFYTRVRTARLAELLTLDQDRLEEFLSEMVSSKQLVARIDRPSGIVTFGNKQSANQQLNDWSSDVAELLRLVESTCHAISKENMFHGIA